MPQSTRNHQLLSRYLKDFKHRQTHCANCGKGLTRVSLVFRQQLINKKSIGRMDRLINHRVWLELQDELIPLCRFCSEMMCKTHARYFDIQAFAQYLLEQTEVRHSTLREYVIRLRRLDELLAEREFPDDALSGDGQTKLNEKYPVEPVAAGENIQQRVADYLPDVQPNSYRSALRQYEQYLHWRKHY